jgi:ATP-dependent helicase HrpA
MLARHEQDLFENASVMIKDWQLMVERFILVQQQLMQVKFKESAIIIDIEQQLTAMIYPGCFAKTPYPWRERLAVYLQGILTRLQKCFEQIDQQLLRQRELKSLWLQYLTIDHDSAAKLEYRFMLEEYRLSLFAQPLKTLKAVSSKRLADLYEQLVIGKN